MTVTSGTSALFKEVKSLENQLANQKDSRQRLILLDRLASHYTFTNVRQGQKHLAEIIKILNIHPNPDIELHYYHNTALIENQLYNFNLAEQHFKKTIEIVEERGDIQQQVDAYIDYAGTCLNLDKRALARQFLEEAADKLHAFPDSLLAARLTARLGFLNLYYAKNSKAVELLLESEKIISAAKHRIGIKEQYFLTLIYSGLGRIYENNGDTEKSVEAYLNGANLCEVMGMRTRLSWHYLNLGKGYMSLNKLDEAHDFFGKAIQIEDDISQDARAAAYANLGRCFFLKENYEEALKLYDKAGDLYKEQRRNNIDLSKIENWKALMFSKMGKSKKAENHFNKAWQLAGENPQQLSEVSKAIAEYYAGKGNFQKAYQFLDTHNRLMEVSNEENNQRMVTEMRVKYEAEKTEQEAELLRLQATSLQLKALRAQMNPHFMYNALNSIQNFITSNDGDSATKYLAKFAKLMRQSLEYSDLEYISLEKEIEFLEIYLNLNQKLRFEKNLTYQIIVGDEIEEDIMGVPTMIIQPYVENAIEHGLRTIEHGLVKVEFNLYDDDNILAIVEDNGIGREKVRERQRKDGYHLNHRSRGTSITEQRLSVLNKSNKSGFFVRTIDLKDKDGKPLGTRVEVKIPIIDLQIKI